MINHFSEKAQKVIILAESIAFDLKQGKVSTEHILLALLKIKESKIRIYLEKYNYDYASIKNEICKKNNLKTEYFLEYELETRRLIDLSIKYSQKIKEEKVSIDTLSTCLVNLEDNKACELLKKKIDIHDLRLVLSKKQDKNELDSIEQLINLNDKVVKNGIKLIGRKKELIKISEVLLRKNKSNPLLVGDPGVGKTAIVEYLAYNIVNANVDEKLRDKIIYELDIPSVIAGTKYRGEFEEKLKKIIAKVIENKNAIIFIDEIHSIVGVGGAEGAIDASNILKPYLARNELKCIGATTYDEYVKYIEKERALERRFQYIYIDEPNLKDTQEILKGIKNSYEKFHNVKISDEIIENIIELTNNYIKNRHNPDKSIDVLDLVCVKTKQNEENNVTRNCVIEVIEELANVKIEEKKDLLKIKNELAEQIKGQNKAIEKIIEQLEKLNENINDRNKPQSIFLFVGPSGVGKSETAKLLAKNYYGSEDSLIRLDMSEYSEANSISKLIGSNPGYVGFENSTYLNDNVQKHPHSLILLDEIEKAHKDIYNLLLQVFDEGYYIDNKKRKIDFSNCIIIMTSNIGCSHQKKQLIGFNKINEYINNEIEKYFPNEFLNRIDEIIVYEKLTKQDYEEIIKTEYQKLTNEVLDNEEIEDIISLSKCEKFGVRGLKRILKKHYLTNLAKKVKN